jgi:DNA replicative helicase MCM subunit Mcm2 (Cdc46/Mcm family)
MFLDMCHDPDIIQKLAASIAPKIKGADDIKMAIACLLFGGSRKVSSPTLKSCPHTFFAVQSLCRG